MAGENLSSYWVKDVNEFSSEYDNTSYSARSIIGPPKVYPNYGDNPGAWAHRDATAGTEYIVVAFEEKVFIKEIHIYETYNAGAVVKIELNGPEGEWVEVYKVDQPTHVQNSRIFSPSIRQTRFRSQEVKITLDCSAANDWCELDAVQIKGNMYGGAPPPPLEDLTRDLGSLVNNAEFSDVTFTVDGQTLYGHKAVLVVRCSYFRSLLQKQSSVSTFTISALAYKPFHALLQFVYTNDTDRTVSPDVLTDLLRFAKEHSLVTVENFCNFRIFESMTPDNVVMVYRNACEKRPVLERVKEMCLDQMATQMDKVSTTEAFKALPQSLMLDIIQQSTARFKIK